MAAVSTWQIFVLAMAVMAFGIGVFFVTYSADLLNAGEKRRTRWKGWGLLACFVVGVLIAGL